MDFGDIEIEILRRSLAGPGNNDWALERGQGLIRNLRDTHIENQKKKSLFRD